MNCPTRLAYLMITVLPRMVKTIPTANKLLTDTIAMSTPIKFDINGIVFASFKFIST